MTNVEVASLVKPSERRVYSILHNNLNMREVWLLGAPSVNRLKETNCFDSILMTTSPNKR